MRGCISIQYISSPIFCAAISTLDPLGTSAPRLSPSPLLTCTRPVLLIQGIIQVFGPQVIIVTYSVVWVIGFGVGGGSRGVTWPGVTSCRAESWACDKCADLGAADWHSSTDHQSPELREAQEPVEGGQGRGEIVQMRGCPQAKKAQSVCVCLCVSVCF